jgi:hypothetical protein
MSQYLLRFSDIMLGGGAMATLFHLHIALQVAASCDVLPTDISWYVCSSTFGVKNVSLSKYPDFA